MVVLLISMTIVRMMTLLHLVYKYNLYNQLLRVNELDVEGFDVKLLMFEASVRNVYNIYVFVYFWVFNFFPRLSGDLYMLFFRN